MIVYFNLTSSGGSSSSTIVSPTPLSTFQTWYGRTNYWRNDIAITESELVACKNSGISGYMISLDPWNCSFNMNNTEAIVNDLATLLQICQNLGLWLVVTVGSETTNREVLDNLRDPPKAAIYDEEGYGNSATVNLTIGTGAEEGMIVGFDINGSLSNYRNPKIIVSRSPTGNDASIVIKSDRSLPISNPTNSDFIISNKGSGYNTNFDNNLDYYKSLIDILVSKVNNTTNKLSLSNLAIIPISNMNDDKKSNTEIIDYITNKISANSISYLYNGNLGNPQTMEFPAYAKMNVFHPSSILESSGLYEGAAIISTPVEDTCVYSDILDNPLTFESNNVYTPWFISIADRDENDNILITKNISQLNKMYYDFGVNYKLYINTLNASNFDFGIVELGDNFRVCQYFEDKIVASDFSFTNYSNIDNRLFRIATDSEIDDSSIMKYYIHQYGNSNLYIFSTSASDDEDAKAYCKLGDRYNGEMQKTREVIDTIDRSVNYSDINNMTSINNLALWVARCRSAGALIVGYDSFYRVTSEKSILSILDASNY